MSTVQDIKKMLVYDEDPKYTISVVEYFMDEDGKPYCALYKDEEDGHIIEKKYTVETTIRTTAVEMFCMACEWCTKCQPESNNYFRVTLYAPRGVIIKSLVVTGELSMGEYAKRLDGLHEYMDEAQGVVNREIEGYLELKEEYENGKKERKMLADERKRMIDDYCNGYPIATLSAKYGLSKLKIIKTLKYEVGRDGYLDTYEKLLKEAEKQ